MMLSPLLFLALANPLDTYLPQGGVVAGLLLAIRYLVRRREADQKAMKDAASAHKDELLALVEKHRVAVQALTEAHQAKLDAVNAERVEEMRLFIRATQLLEKKAAMMSDSPKPRRTPRQ